MGLGFFENLGVNLEEEVGKIFLIVDLKFYATCNRVVYSLVQFKRISYCQFLYCIYMRVENREKIGKLKLKIGLNVLPLDSFKYVIK